MPRRLAAYAALAREKYGLDVYVVVIYLLPPPEDVTLAEDFHVTFMNQTTRQDFRLIRLWDLNANEALALNNPALVPFIPLMQGGDNEQTLRRCVTRVQQELDAEELVAALALLAGLVMDKDVVRRIVGLNMHLLKAIPKFKLSTKKHEVSRRIAFSSCDFVDNYLFGLA